jgi:hypothetical protein
MGNRRKGATPKPSGQAEPESLLADLLTDDQAARLLESVDWPALDFTFDFDSLDWPELETIDMPAIDWSFADNLPAWQPEDITFDFGPLDISFDQVDSSSPPQIAGKSRKKQGRGTKSPKRTKKAQNW